MSRHKGTNVPKQPTVPPMPKKRRYIDADKLQEAFKELHGGKRSLLIDTEPTADVRENVRGEWIYWYEEIENDTCTEYIPHCKCSECGTEYDPHTVKFINFCPNCGAEMGGES